MARPKKYDDDLKRRLLADAAAQIADGGVAGLSLREVAAAAGTSTNAVYALFGSKDHLVEAVVTEASRSFTAAQRAPGCSGDPVADLAALGLAYRAWARANPALYAVMFGGRVAKQADLSDDEAMAPLREAVVRARAAGVLRADLDELVTSTSVWASIHGLVSLEIGGYLPTGASMEALFGAHLDAMLVPWLAAGEPIRGSGPQ